MEQAQQFLLGAAGWVIALVLIGAVLLCVLVYNRHKAGRRHYRGMYSWDDGEDIPERFRERPVDE